MHKQFDRQVYARVNMGVTVMRKLAFIAAISIWLIPLQGMALGLGDITAKSYLNQPLNSEISLHSLRAGDLEELEVRIADQRDYQRAQIPWQDWMSKVKFKIEKDKKGGAIIRMRTKTSVQEPFLNFLVKAVWANGRVLKQYTLLIDPIGATVPTEEPVAMPGPAVSLEPVPIEETAAISPSFDNAPSFSEPDEPPPPPPPAQSFDEPATAEVVSDDIFDRSSRPSEPAVNTQPETFSGPNEYSVQKGDYAWRIAEQFRSDNSQSIQQILMALLEANPDAFVDGNVNRLKAGVVVRLPDAAQVTGWKKQDAINELARQNTAWREYQQNLAGAASDVSIARSDEGSSFDSEPVQESGSDSLLDSGSETPQFEVTNVEDAKTIKGKIKLVNEGIDSKREEQKDLQSKLAALEDQKGKLNTLIKMQSKALGVTPDNLGGDERTLANLTNNDLPPAVDVDGSPQISDVSKSVQDDLEIIDENDESGMWSLLENPKVVGLLVGVVLVFGILFWLIRRKSMNLDEFQESILTNAGANTNSELSQTMSSGGGLGGNSSLISDFTASGLSSGIQSEVNVMDPLAEADVYLAYGRFQHAEELMKEAINKDPSQAEFKAKLLEIYSAMKEKQGFIRVAKELHEATGGKGPLWDKAYSLGQSLCPEDTLFGGDGGGGTIVEETMQQSDLASANPSGLEVGELGTGQKEVPNLDDSMNFDFGGADVEETQSAQVPAAASVEDTNIIDFDFGKSGEEEAASLEETAIISPEGDGAQADDGLLDFKSLGEGDHELSALEETQISGGNGTAAASPVDQAMDEDSLFQDIDEVGTKLDLARAYIDMGDPDGAKSILGEVIEEGNNNQKEEANELLQDIG